MTGKLITSNYLFIQLPCNLFLASIENKSWGSRIWPSYIRLLLKPTEYLDSVQISWKETVNQPTPPYYQKTWDSYSRFLLNLKKDSHETLKADSWNSFKASNPLTVTSSSIDHHWSRFVEIFDLEQMDIERAPEVSPSKYSERTISEAVFSAPS